MVIYLQKNFHLKIINLVEVRAFGMFDPIEDKGAVKKSSKNVLQHSRK